MPISLVFREDGPEQIREGAPIFYETSQKTKNVKRFLAGLHFEHRGKLGLVRSAIAKRIL